jgi:hypothetical protein
MPKIAAQSNVNRRKPGELTPDALTVTFPFNPALVLFKLIYFSAITATHVHNTTGNQSWKSGELLLCRLPFCTNQHHF